MPTTAPQSGVVATTVLPTADMAAAAGFYRRLGFEVQAYDDGYAWVLHGGHELLHLRLVTDLDRDANRASGYLHVHDVDTWHDRWAAAGMPTGPLVDQPWGMREFTLTDGDANLLRIGQQR